MADTAIAITAGTGTNVDTRTEDTNGNHRQVIVVGDPSTNAGVAPVSATAGLKVDLGADNDVTVTSGTLAATQSGVWTVQPGNTANTTAWKVDGSAVTQPVSGTVTAAVTAISTSVTPGTGATNLGKAEDAAHSSGDTGVMTLAVRNDTAAALAGTTGDYIPVTTNARGATWIAIEDGAGGQVTSFSAPTQYTEDAAAAADPVGSVLMAVRRDTLTTSEVSADGDNVAVKATNKGQLHVYADLGTQIGSLGRAAAASSASTAFCTEDAALFPTSVGSKAAASSFAVTASTEDIARVGIITETAPASDTASSGLNGRLQRVAQRITSLIALLPTALGSTTSSGSLPVVIASDQAVIPTGGAVAHDGVDSGNPTKLGGYAKAAAPTDVSADADRVNAWFLRNGSLATTVTAAGALIGGDATNGLDVDVTRMSALVAGSAIIGKVGIDQTTPGTTNLVAVTSQGYSSGKVSVTRPANTTAYSAGDVVGATAAAITFPTIGPSGGGPVMITSASLEIDIAAIPSGMTSFTLHLYNVTPPSALADNAAFDLPSGDRTAHIGSFSLGTPVDLGSTLKVKTDAINQQITAASGTIYGYLVTTGGFTPASNSEVYVVTLHTVAL